MKEKLLAIISDRRFQVAVAAIVLLIVQQYVGGVNVPVLP